MTTTPNEHHADPHAEAEKIAASASAGPGADGGRGGSGPTGAGAAGSANSVRERVRHVVVDAMKEANAGVGRLRDVTVEVMEGAIEGSRHEANGRRRETVLKEVIEGLSDGVQIAANAARLTLEEARGRGESFAREDVTRLATDLQAIESMFVEAVSEAIGRVGDTLSGQQQDLINHARHTAQTIRPSVEQAARAATQHPVMLATDVATAGVRMTTMAVGRFAQALGGVLQSAGGRMATSPPPGGSQQHGASAKSAATGQPQPPRPGQPQGLHPQAPPGGSPIPERPDVASNTVVPDDTRHVPPNAEQDRRGDK